MLSIWLGIKDYLKDCYHDRIYSKLLKIDPDAHAWWWKEGNLKHYVQQRRIAKKVKAQRKKYEY